jgi:uncharacterized protein YycO
VLSVDNQTVSSGLHHFQYQSPDLQWLQQEPQGDANPILLPQFGEAQASVDFIYLGPLPAPDPMDLGLYLHKDPYASSPGCDTVDATKSLRSYFGHPSWQADILGDGSIGLRVATASLTPDSTEARTIYRFTFRLAGNGCTVQSCPDTFPDNRKNLNTNQPLPEDFYREDFGVYQISAKRWLTARRGYGGSPTTQANAWYSIELRAGEGDLPSKQIQVHPQSQPQGGRFVLSGDGYFPGSRIQMEWRPENASLDKPQTITIQPDRKFQTSWATSCGTPPATYEFRVQDSLTCSRSAWTPLQVVDSKACASGAPVCDADYNLAQPGDILVSSKGLLNTFDMLDWLQTLATSGVWHHAGLYIGNNQVIHAMTDTGVGVSNLTETGFYSSSYCAIYRVETDQTTRQAAIDFSHQQEGKPYNINVFDKHATNSQHCAQLVWQAYNSASRGQINLDENIGTPDWLDFFFPDLVIPDDLVMNRSVQYISGTLSPDAFSLTLHRPAVALLRDEQGRQVGLDPESGALINEIPGAVFDMTSDPKYIYISESGPGDYQVRVTGSAEGKYTLRIANLQADAAPQVSEVSGHITDQEQHIYSANLPVDGAAPNLTLQEKIPSPAQQRVTWMMYLCGFGSLLVLTGIAWFWWSRRMHRKVSRPVSDKPIPPPSFVAPNGNVSGAALSPPPAMSFEECNKLLAEANAFMNTRKYNEAESILRKILRASEKNAPAWLMLGVLLAQKRDFRTAERCFLRALHLGHSGAEKALAWLKSQQARQG